MLLSLTDLLGALDPYPRKTLEQRDEPRRVQPEKVRDGFLVATVERRVEGCSKSLRIARRWFAAGLGRMLATTPRRRGEHQDCAKQDPRDRTDAGNRKEPDCGECTFFAHGRA
ncbi:MAG: hypothetical protein U1E76_16500 [Planctomycetota bacterium]